MECTSKQRTVRAEEHAQGHIANYYDKMRVSWKRFQITSAARVFSQVDAAGAQCLFIFQFPSSPCREMPAGKGSLGQTLLMRIAQ